VCHKRNTHSRSLEDVAASAAALEPPPPSFLQLDLSDLFGEAKQREPPAAAAAAPGQVLSNSPGIDAAVGLC